MVAHEDEAASYIWVFFTEMFSAYNWNTYWLWQKHCHHHHHLRGKCFGFFFWIKNSKILPEWTDPRRKKVRMRAMPLHLGFRLLVANVWSQEKEIDEIGLRLDKQHEITDSCSQADLLHNGISDLAVELVRQTVFWADRDRTTEGRGERDFFVYNTDARRSQTVKVNGQCFPDVELFIWRCCPHYHPSVSHTLFHLWRSATVSTFYRYILIFSLWSCMSHSHSLKTVQPTVNCMMFYTLIQW